MPDIPLDPNEVAPGEAAKEAPPGHPETVRAYHADGKAIDLTPAAAQAAFSAGKVGFAQTDRVPVKLADGRVGTVAGGSLAGALQQGASLISPADQHAAEVQKKYGGLLGGVEATGLGALRGGTFGLSDQAGKALLGDKYSETAEDLKAAHPVLTGIGEAGGMVGLGALTGGASALEEGAGALGEGLLGKGLLGQLATKGLAGAAEGAYIGGADAVGEDALSKGNSQLTAEKVFSSMGSNALFGGALGVGGALLGKGAGKLLGALDRTPCAEAVEQVAENQFGYVPQGLGKALVKVQSALAGGGEDIINEAGVQNQSAAAKELRSTLLNIDSEREEATRAVTDHVNTLLQDGQDIADEAKGALKKAHTESAVTKGNLPEVAEHSTATINSARTRIQTMFADNDRFGNAKLFPKIDAELGRYQQDIADAVAKGDNAGQFTAIDNAKRALQNWTKDVKATIAKADPIGFRQGKETFAALDDLSEGLRKNLENEDIWGKAATNQKRINEAWSAQIQADKQFRSTLSAKVGEERYGGAIYAADPGKVARYVGSLTNPDQDLVHKAITDYVKSTKNFVDAVSTSYDLPAAQAAKAARAKAAADAFDITLKDIGGKLAKANQLKALMGGEGGGMAKMALAMAGHAIGGPLGGAVGYAAGELANPGKNILRLAQLDKMMGSVDSKMAGHVDAFFERFQQGKDLAKAAGKRSLSAADDVISAMEGGHERATPAKLVVDTAKEHGKETVKGAYLRRVGAAEGEQQNTQDRYQKSAAAVTKLQQNPAMLPDRMAPHVEGLQQAAPKVTAALGAQAAKAVGYLSSKMPHPPPADVLTGKPGVPPMSEQQRFTTITDTVLHPEKAMQDFARGRITQDQVNALAAVYPQMYAQLQGQVREALTGHTAAGRSLDHQARVQLETLFSIDVEPGSQPPAVHHAQATYAMAPKPQQAHGSPGDSKKLAVGGATQTPAQALEGGGS